ncbi:MAG: tetratricopeptide repeat-containing protein kinase family protein [Acidobacteriota bacterium]
MARSQASSNRPRGQRRHMRRSRWAIKSGPTSCVSCSARAAWEKSSGPSRRNRSNILVAEVDGEPVPKIIDFGIVKGLDAPLAAGAAPTGDRFLGTPAYMSPEALETARELDPRSDVFALGILLYELLTGSHPWPASGGDPAQVMKQRLERDADRPSTQVTSLGAARRLLVAQQRRVYAGDLIQRLRGDLDSLVMKAIEPQPDRRYDSAAELAADIERHLADEPIQARPLTGWVALGKLARRHRTAALGAAAVALALLVGAMGTFGGLLRAREAERRAVAEAAAAIEARDEANRVADFLVGIFDASDSQSLDAREGADEITAREILARGAERIKTELADQPMIRARLTAQIGVIYRDLGRYDDARELLYASLAALESTSDPPPIEIADRHLRLAELEIRLADREAVTRHLDQATAALDLLPETEALHLRGDVFSMRGRLMRSKGDFEGSEVAFKQAIAAFERSEQPERRLESALTNLGNTYFALRRWAEAERLFQQTLDLVIERFEDGHPLLAQTYNNLGAAIASQGRLGEASEMFQAAERHLRLRLGAQHPTLAQALNNLGVLHRDLGRLERSERVRDRLSRLQAVAGCCSPKAVRRISRASRW